MKNYWLKYKKRATQADCTFLMLDKVFLLHLLEVSVLNVVVRI